MICVRCNSSQLEPRRVYKLSGCLVALGFMLLASSVAAVLGAIVVTVAGTGLTGAASVSAVNELKAESIEKLRKIPDLPPSVVQDFETDGNIEDRRLADLPPDTRRQVKEIERAYHITVGATATATGCIGCIGGMGVILLFVYSVPALIVGLLLVLKKNTWQCMACASVYDRA
jgi:hypothetical protein